MDTGCAEKKYLPAHMLLIYLLLFDIIIIIAAMAIGVHDGQPLRYFEEGRFTTWISSLQLCAVSWLAGTILNVRRPKAGLFHWHHPFIIWALISIGFLFLAFDELFMLHESFDQKIHHFFNMKVTGLSDRIDDLIVGIYGIFSVLLLYIYREEMKNYRQARPFLVCGFSLLFVMVLIDALTNRKDVLTFFIERRDIVKDVYIVLSIAEDSLKMLAESSFLAGFYAASLIARRISGTPIGQETSTL